MLLSAGVEPPRGLARPRLAARGRREDEQDGAATRSRRLDLVADFGVDGFRYYFLADTPVRRRRRLHLRGHGRPLQRRPGQQPRQPADPRRHRRRQEVRRHRSGAVGPTARSLAAAAERRRGRGRGLGRGPAERARSTRRGGSSGRPTPTSRPTSRGRPSPAPRSTPCWATPSRRCASWPLLASPAIPGTAQTIWERIGLPGAVADQRLPDALAWGGYPGGLTVTKGAPLFPRRTA